jgi:hypothetical protein
MMMMMIIIIIIIIIMHLFVCNVERRTEIEGVLEQRD